MSTPTQKHTKSRKKIRRGTIKINSNLLVVCPKCKKLIPPHRACPFCGTYKGKEIVKIRIPKKFRKRKKREEKKNQVH